MTKHENIVKDSEMRDMRQWLASMIDNLTRVEDTAAVRPDIESISQDWGTLQMGLSVIKKPILLAGRTFASGLGTHADSEIVVRLPVGVRRLTGCCGVNDSPQARQFGKELVFSVEVSGKEIWHSGEQTANCEPAAIDVKMGGCREFTLKVKGPNPLSYGHASWADLKTTLSNGKTVVIGEGVVHRDVGFSFLYGGKSSKELLQTWNLKQKRLPEKDGIVHHRITRTDPKTGLAVICEIKEYTQFPVVEWGIRFKNTSKRKTPILEQIHSLDLKSDIGKHPYLNYWTGDSYSPDGYEPFRVSLAHGEEFRFAPRGGRPTDCAWPYFNVEGTDTNRGLIVVVGWSGQWTSSFRGLSNRDNLDNYDIHIAAGQEQTHFRLLPGEEARTPLSILMFYHGDRARSRNLWRRWYLTHNLPRPGGQPMKPHLACWATDEGEEFTAATEKNQIHYLDKFNKQGIRPDVWWIDAGWYPCYNKDHERRWAQTGTWEPDLERFPRGLKPISDHAARAGADLLVWFEPERVMADSKLGLEHPEFQLKIGKTATRLLNLGDPKCRKSLTDHVCKLIRDNGIKIYRQDFNIAPLEYWRQNEADDRQGMNENLHVQGYLRYWDDLLARNPGLWIDSCASGGRRNDIETMRRAVPLHYTDHGYGNTPLKLAFQSTLCEWLPYFKEFTLSHDIGGESRFDHRVDSYSFHCSLAPMLCATMDIRRDDYDFALARKMIAIWRSVADLMLHGDYYPLTPYHRSSRQWVSRQFDCPEEGKGFIQAIRLPDAIEKTLKVFPQAFRPDTLYRFENPETGEKRELAGKALQHGFAVALPQREGALWIYHSV